MGFNSAFKGLNKKIAAKFDRLGWSRAAPTAVHRHRSLS